MPLCAMKSPLQASSRLTKASAQAAASKVAGNNNERQRLTPLQMHSSFFSAELHTRICLSHTFITPSSHFLYAVEV